MQFVALVAISIALGYAAWLSLSRTPKRPGQAAVRRVVPPNDSMGFVSVAGEGVELEIIAPDGIRTTTHTKTDSLSRIPHSDATLDCPGFSSPTGNEEACTASVHVNTPRPGDYVIVARGNDTRAVILNVGWATASQILHGAFDVPVQVTKGGAMSFTIIVAKDNVSQRTQPRAGAP